MFFFIYICKVLNKVNIIEWSKMNYLCECIVKKIEMLKIIDWIYDFK